MPTTDGSTRPATGWSLGGLGARRPITEALLWDVLLRRALDRGCGRGGAMRESETSRGWEGALERWLAPFLSALGRGAQRRWAPVYLKGLILPGERKSVEPLAARVAPGGTEQLHHFIGGSPW